MNNYILDDNGNPVVELNPFTWAVWFEKAERTIARDEIAGVTVSTVFLGIDHRFGPGTPLLFETMVFGGSLDEEQERYGTHEEAIKGHAAMVERVKAALR